MRVGWQRMSGYRKQRKYHAIESIFIHERLARGKVGTTEETARAAQAALRGN